MTAQRKSARTGKERQFDDATFDSPEVQDAFHEWYDTAALSSSHPQEQAFGAGWRAAKKRPGTGPTLQEDIDRMNAWLRNP